MKRAGHNTMKFTKAGRNSPVGAGAMLRACGQHGAGALIADLRCWHEAARGPRGRGFGSWLKVSLARCRPLSRQTATGPFAVTRFAGGTGHLKCMVDLPPLESSKIYVILNTEGDDVCH